MKKRLTFFFLMMPALSCLAQQVYSCKQGTASFFSEALLENIEAHSNSINSFLNLSTKEIAFIIPMRGFKFEKSLMQEHFNEKYIESDKFPNATYTGKINGEINMKANGTYQVTSTGTLTIHGVEKKVTQSGTMTIATNEMHLASQFLIAINDFDIKIPKLLFQNIADTVLVKLQVAYQPFQKK